MLTKLTQYFGKNKKAPHYIIAFFVIGFFLQQIALSSKIFDVLHIPFLSSLASIEYLDYDLKLKNKPKGKISSHVAVVRIDEPSLKAYGQFPFPRKIFADLALKLKSLGVQIDILSKRQKEYMLSWRDGTK